MSTGTDPDCSRVAFWPQYPEITHRCTQPKGHAPDKPCWLRNVEVLNPQHRAPVPTDEDPHGVRSRGGKHRRMTVVADAMETAR